jgi:hemerythrin
MRHSTTEVKGVKEMGEYHYPEFEAPKKQHIDFIAAINNIASKFSMHGDNHTVHVKLTSISFGWLKQHFTKVNTKLAAFPQ